jgi:hypothetical protein
MHGAIVSARRPHFTRGAYVRSQYRCFSPQMRHPERRNATQRLQTALNHLVPSPSSVHHLAASGSSGAGGWTPPMRPHGPDQDVDRAAALRIGMSEKETEFFKTNGFIVKRGLIPQKDLQPFVDHMWKHMLPCLDRESPGTWVDPGQQHAGGWGPSAELMAMASAAGADVRSGRAMDVAGGVNRPYPASYGDNAIKWCDILLSHRVYPRVQCPPFVQQPQHLIRLTAQRFGNQVRDRWVARFQR